MLHQDVPCPRKSDYQIPDRGISANRIYLYSEDSGIIHGLGGEGRARNGRLATIGPLTSTFESDFFCGFWLWAPLCLVIFFEAFFDLAFLLRVFFLVMIITR